MRSPVTALKNYERRNHEREGQSERLALEDRPAVQMTRALVTRSSNHPRAPELVGENLRASAPEFLGFLSQRLNLNESDAVEVLGRLLAEYRSQTSYEISMLGPVRKCGERFEP